MHAPEENLYLSKFAISIRVLPEHMKLAATCRRQHRVVKSFISSIILQPLSFLSGMMFL